MTKHLKGKDGLTAFERLYGKPYVLRELKYARGHAGDPSHAVAVLERVMSRDHAWQGVKALAALPPLWSAW